MSRLDYNNIVLMVAALLVATILPFDLLILSYVVLGPLHYLTEISWLRDRNFFVAEKGEMFLIFGVGLLAVFGAPVLLGRFSFPLLTFLNPSMIAICFCSIFHFSIFSNKSYKWPSVLLLVASTTLLSSSVGFRSLFGLWLPTLVHVYVFTGLFILLGAMKGKRISGYVSFCIFLLCPVLLFFYPGNFYYASNWSSENYLMGFSKLNNTITGLSGNNDNSISHGSLAVTRCIAFAYCYHYLNWFSKVKVIRWSNITLARGLIIVFCLDYLSRALHHELQIGIQGFVRP